MRPKKKILLIDANEERQSRLRYVLEINRYRVLGAASCAEARAIAVDFRPELAIAAWPLPAAELHAALDLMRRQAGTASLALCEGMTEPPADLFLFVDQVCCGHKCYAAEILERARVLCARKRGPRKGAQRAPQSEPAQKAAAA